MASIRGYSSSPPTVSRRLLLVGNFCKLSLPKVVFLPRETPAHLPVSLSKQKDKNTNLSKGSWLVKTRQWQQSLQAGRFPSSLFGPLHFTKWKGSLKKALGKGSLTLGVHMGGKTVIWLVGVPLFHKLAPCWLRLAGFWQAPVVSFRKCHRGTHLVFHSNPRHLSSKNHQLVFF